LPIFVAEHLGLFKEEGIDAKIVVIRSDIVMKGLVTGDVDFASSVSSVVKAAAIGAPVKTLINFFNGSFFYLVTKPDVSNVNQLKGKTVAISRYGSATDFDARATLRHFNLDPGKDVQILAVGGGPTRIAALVSGRVDSAILNNIEKIPAEKAGMKSGDIIVRFGDKKIENIYDYTYALQEHKAGETVTVVVLRDNKEVSLNVTLEKRAQSQ